MNPAGVDIASLRHRNALALFEEFVRATVAHPDAATLRGLEGRFAQRMGIQPSYWSQIKSRSRQIGERLARQFEMNCSKPAGWLDQAHDTPPQATQPYARTAAPTAPAAAPMPGTPTPPLTANDLPRDDDERFIVGLVLSYYRRNPARARQRLLDMLGEVLLVAPTTAAAAPPRTDSPSPVNEQTLWLQSQRGVAPLKKKT